MSVWLVFILFSSIGFIAWASYDIGFDRGWDAKERAGSGRLIHRQGQNWMDEVGNSIPVCEECGLAWPCPSHFGRGQS